MLPVKLEQTLVGADALRDSLGVVEPIDAQHHLFAFGLRLRRCSTRALLELVVGNADREGTHARSAVAVFD